MKSMLRSGLAGLLWLAAFCAGRSEADVIILGTRVIYPFRARLQRTTGNVTAGRINRAIAVRVTFR